MPDSTTRSPVRLIDPRPARRRGPRLGRILAGAIAALFFSAASEYALAGEITHVVGKGQTLGKIAKRYHVSVESIREVNNLKPGQRIHPGLSLTIPEKGKEAEAIKKAQQARKGDGDAGRGKKESGRGTKAKKGDDAGTKKDDADDSGFARAPRRPGLVRLSRGSESLQVQLLTRRGKLATNALTGLAKMLRFAPTGEKISIDPRLASMVGMVSDHFGGRVLKVVSGYRPYSPVQYTPHSAHNLGRAMDFTVEGVPNTVLRDFCRTFRNAGVGYYPNSSFVHLDARAGKTFWIDYSRPGEAPHYDAPGSGPSGDDQGGDGEPHAGAVDGPPGPSEVDPGSTKTQDRPSQVPDLKGGNSPPPDRSPAAPPAAGQ
ncbi:MAG: DUF882 domain-containing protein [Byssovorax sp.]